MSPTMGGATGDSLDALPTDQSPPSHDEVKMVETLFKQKHSTMQKIMRGAKEFVFMFLLFVVVSLPQVSGLIRKFITVAESPYILILIQGVLFTIVYFLVKNMYLVRKN